MQPELYLTLVIGLILSLIYAEITGVVPAGLIVPGYLALSFDQPLFLVLVLLISLLTYLVVAYGIEKITILYGRRQFVAMIIVGLGIKLALEYFYPMIPIELYGLSGVGVIVPGLIANTIYKQGLMHTLSSTLVLSGLTFLIVTAYNLY